MCAAAPFWAVCLPHSGCCPQHANHPARACWATPHSHCEQCFPATRARLAPALARALVWASGEWAVPTCAPLSRFLRPRTGHTRLHKGRRPPAPPPSLVCFWRDALPPRAPQPPACFLTMLPLPSEARVSLCMPVIALMLRTHACKGAYKCAWAWPAYAAAPLLACATCPPVRPLASACHSRHQCPDRCFAGAVVGSYPSVRLGFEPA